MCIHIYTTGNWGEKSDILRLELLQRYGGVYVSCSVLQCVAVCCSVLQCVDSNMILSVVF